jgi:hypothetical protein
MNMSNTCKDDDKSEIFGKLSHLFLILTLLSTLISSLKRNKEFLSLCFYFQLNSVWRRKNTLLLCSFQLILSFRPLLEILPYKTVNTRKLLYVLEPKFFKLWLWRLLEDK